MNKRWSNPHNDHWIWAGTMRQGLWNKEIAVSCRAKWHCQRHTSLPPSIPIWNASGPHGEGDVKLRAAVRYVISIDHIIHFIHSIYTISLGEVIRIESKVDGRVRGWWKGKGSQLLEAAWSHLEMFALLYNTAIMAYVDVRRDREPVSDGSRCKGSWPLESDQ